MGLQRTLLRQRAVLQRGSPENLGNGRIFTFGTVSIWYNPERSFRRFARILNNRSVIAEQVFRKESRNTALSDDLIQPFSTKTRRYIDKLSTHKTITLALMCALASTTVLTGCKVEARMRDVAAEYDKTEKQGKTAPSFQFMRLGYFCLDNKDCSADHLVFNRSVTLKDSFKV